MTGTDAPQTLFSRIPGQSVIGELLRGQAAVRPRSSVSRALGSSPLSDETRPWYLGALGEIEVGRLLAGLGSEWTVLHAVPVGKGDSDIDHVLIGPGGVFTVNTKRHAGQNVWVAGRTVMVAGQKKPYIRNSEHEARRAGKLLTTGAGLDAHVTPVIVVVGPKSLTIRESPENVAVVSAGHLVRWLRKRPPVLTPSEVEVLVRAAGDPHTWHTRPVEPEDGARLRNDFDALHADVVRARRRRFLWRAGGMLVVGIAAVAAYQTLVRSMLEGIASM